MSSPAELAETQARVTEEEYVGFTADWLTDASDFDSEPPLTGNRVIDVLVSAAAAYAKFTTSGEVPVWTAPPTCPQQFLAPGAPEMFANPW